MKFKRFISVFLLCTCLTGLFLTPAAGALEVPDIQAKAALLADVNTDAVAYAKNIHEKNYPASLTKIMTCLLALENGNLSDVVTVSASALDDLDADSSVAGLQVGEQMTLENLLYCMMVVSGNDACNVIAEHIAGSVADFVRMMNQRAYELGCLNTHFSNPHGLLDESHYTTARDLAIITEAALKSETIPAVTYCEGCGRDYPTVQFGRPCPHCGREKTWLPQGSEINLKEIEAL